MNWKKLIGFSKYLINEYGDIYNIEKGIFMKYFINNKGYKCIYLTDDSGILHRFLIHRLVAIAFISNYNSYPIVLHKDNDKLNTYYTNLKWGTYSENNSQAIKDGLNKLPHPDNRVCYGIYTKEGEPLIYKFGISSIANEIGYNFNTESIRNLIYRNSPIKSGNYNGCYIKKADNLKNGLIFLS